ncbi:MAG: 3-phosphoshikimate 1-carboxyvinyltransferase [Chloroflexi bacterium]|nr:3-phosphoshikimate 1-carboxyvinyltransferase [Chloroflexota bacterium]
MIPAPASTVGTRPAGGGTTVIRPAARLRGEIRPPGDKSISHRALLLALLGEGESRIVGAGDGADVRSTADVVAALGATVERIDEATGGRTAGYRVASPGAAGIVEPTGVLDCRNSGTTLRLVAGIVAARPLFAVLDGDASLRRRPMARVAEPLRAMGARIGGRARGTLPPLAIEGRSPLVAIDHASPVPSAQVKSCVLLAGLGATGVTSVHETFATRDHTERMLRARGVAVTTERLPGGRRLHAVAGGQAILPRDELVPGDLSGAAFWLVAGAIHPDAEIVVRDVGTNPTRRAIIDLLRRMGATIEERSISPAEDDGIGEPSADLVVRSSRLRGIDVDPGEVAAAIDEVPVLCLAAAVADGRTRIRGAGELRHKETDRVAGIAAGLRAFGAEVAVDGDEIIIDGGRALAGAVTEAHDDHRLAMTFAVAGLIAGGETAVRDADSAAVSYPGFFAELERVRA